MSDAAQKPKSRKLGCWLLWIALLVVFFLPSAPSILEGKKIRDIIAKADSVTVVEYKRVNRKRYYSEELTRVVLTQEQASELKSVFYRFRIFNILGGAKMCSFNPHHCLVCTKSDGSTDLIHLCFQCGDVAVNSGGTTEMGRWDKKLRSFLAKVGMPIREGMYKFDFK